MSQKAPLALRADVVHHMIGDAASSSESSKDELSRLRADVLAVFEGGQSLDSALVDVVSRFIRRIAGGRQVPPLLSMLVIGVVPLVVGVCLSWFTRESIAASWVLLLFMCLLPFFSLIGLDVALRGWRTEASLILDLLTDPADLQRARAWAADAFNVKRQAIVAVCFASCLSLTASAAALAASYHVASFIYVDVFLASLLLGCGFYWGIVSPLGVNAICDSEKLRVYPFDPSATPGINTLSRILGTHSVVGAFMIVLGLPAFLYIGSQKAGTVFMTVLVAWGIIGSLNELYVFAHPQYRLYRVISREKRRTLDELRRRIDAMYSTMEVMDKETLATIHEAIELYGLIQSTRSTTLSITSVLQQVSSTLLPLAAYLAGELDWSKVFSAFRR